MTHILLLYKVDIGYASISGATALLSVDTFNVVRRRLIFSFVKRIFEEW